MAIRSRRSGEPAAAGTVTLRDGEPFAPAGRTIRNRRIVEMDFVTDPELLSQIDLSILD
jgi:hypothetical protein